MAAEITNSSIVQAERLTSEIQLSKQPAAGRHLAAFLVAYQQSHRAGLSTSVPGCAISILEIVSNMKETDLDLDASTPDKANFVNNFLTHEKPPKEAMQHFASIPWTNSWITDPAYESVPFWSRHLKSSGEDYFFARTINTPITVPHMISLRLKDLKSPEAEGWKPDEDTSTCGTSSKKAAVDKQPELVVLVQFGERGVDGHPSMIHGGVTCALLDEIMSLLVTSHRMNRPVPELSGSLFTANLTTSFRAPIPTPGQVLVKCWLVRRERRKWLTKGQIVDRQGQILAEGDAVWVVARKSKI